MSSISFKGRRNDTFVDTTSNAMLIDEINESLKMHKNLKMFLWPMKVEKFGMATAASCVPAHPLTYLKVLSKYILNW